MPMTEMRAECPQCGHLYDTPLPKLKMDIAQDLVDYFDLTLLQNVDAIKQVKERRDRCIVRMGGMVINKKAPANRYDEELARAGAVIATNGQLHEIAARCNDQAYLIPNGTDLELFRPGEPNPNYERQFTVGFAGNIWGLGLQYKGYKYYVQAVTRLFDQVKTKQCLHAHSQIPHNKMPEDFYHKIDCLVLPSVGEGCSNVIMEALACGVPVICTKVGFHGERLIDGDDVIFIERDVQQIMDAILKLKDNRALRERLAFNGRLFAENHHDINRIAAQYDAVFQDIFKKLNQK
jgi:hypothetical protein